MSTHFSIVSLGISLYNNLGISSGRSAVRPYRQCLGSPYWISRRTLGGWCCSEIFFFLTNDFVIPHDTANYHTRSTLTGRYLWIYFFIPHYFTKLKKVGFGLSFFKKHWKWKAISVIIFLFHLQIWFIGRTLASQAGKAGSIPVICFFGFSLKVRESRYLSAFPHFLLFPDQKHFCLKMQHEILPQ